VPAKLSDRKIAHSSNSSVIDYYTADLISAQDYYPFGMIMPGRTIVNGSVYRYGFNGKENDNEVKETGNQQDYGMRIYDPRIGKFLSVDPLTKDYPWNSSYAFAENNPIKYIDLDGLEKAKHWFDYDINDFMAWLGDNDNKPSKVIDRSVRSVNRNINPLGILTYNGYQIITGRDLDTKAPASRIDGLGNIVIAGIFHQSAVKLATPTATMQLEGQMASNAAAMNTVRRTASQEASANSIAKQQSSLVGRPMKIFLESATKESKNGLTQVGRALQKHAGREGSSFADLKFSAKTGNRQGLEVLKEILNSKNQLIKEAENGTTSIFDKTTGRGVNVSRNGEFNGFRDMKEIK
jgi:RHS repeat-associated protein